MADYEPGHYRSGFEDDERRAPYATDFGGRAETRYATGYGYGPTYGGTAGAYGATYGGTTAGGYGGTRYGAGHGATGYAGASYGTTGHSIGNAYGHSAGAGYGSFASEAGYGANRFGVGSTGRHEGTSVGSRSWRDEGAGERRYPDYTRSGSSWAHQEESRFGEPGRAGISQSITGMQGFGAFGQGVPVQRRRIGNRQYGPY
jgi:hypothetical protein